METNKLLKGFSVHGVSFSRESGNQAIGGCPFCGKEGHLFVNTANRLWDCKRCGLKGNFNTFLELVSKQNVKNLTDKRLNDIAANRKLPKAAFNKWELGWNGKEYTIPVRNAKGVVEDLRRWKLGGKAMATTGANLGLLGMHKLALMPGKDVFVCEGEWDTIALAWLFKKLDTQSVAVGVPGASIFKNEWIEAFVNRRVFLLHDNDGAGEAGKKLCYEKLRAVSPDIKIIRWPETLPTGFDVRDFVTNEAVRNQKPRKAWGMLKSLLVSPLEAVPSSVPPTAQPGTIVPVKPTERVNPKEIADAYRKWLHMPSDEALQVLFGMVFANKIQGEPLWIFLVAPPGGSKSELLMSLSSNPLVESTTSLTPHTLVSGANFQSGTDPSLLPKLNNRILVIKDFTTILTMHYTSRDEIFGVLRDCYDGKTEKNFGTGLKRSYVSHFGILAGVTPKIEEFGVMHQSLGERFLKYRLNTGSKTLSETDRIRRALSNINREKQMREELCTAANRVLGMPLPESLPTIPSNIFEMIINLAQTCAMMRGVVDRDRWTQQVIYKPMIEVGTRLAKQLAKLAIGVSIYRQEKEVSLEVYDLIRRIALDTAPDRVEETVRQLWEGTKEEGSTLRTIDVSQKTRLPVATCFRVLQDLELLRLVERVGAGNKYEWKLGKKLVKLLVDGKVYEGER